MSAPWEDVLKERAREVRLVASQDAAADVTRVSSFVIAHNADGDLVRASFNGKPVTLPELLCSLTMMLSQMGFGAPGATLRRMPGDLGGIADDHIHSNIPPLDEARPFPSLGEPKLVSVARGTGGVPSPSRACSSKPSGEG